LHVVQIGMSGVDKQWWSSVKWTIKYEGRLSQQAAAAQAGISSWARIHGVHMIVNIVEMLHILSKQIFVLENNVEFQI